MLPHHRDLFYRVFFDMEPGEPCSLAFRPQEATHYPQRLLVPCPVSGGPQRPGTKLQFVDPVETLALPHGGSGGTRTRVRNRFPTVLTCVTWCWFLSHQQSHR